MRFIKEFFSNDSGFTLIEAIITVAIVGMIATPISMVFMKGLESTLETKKLLQGNQLAQLYIENIKAKTEEDFLAFFPSSSDTSETITGDNFSSDYLDGFPKVPDGYSVEIRYDKVLLDNSITALDTHSDVSGFDLEIDLNTIFDNSFSLYDNIHYPNHDNVISNSYVPSNLMDRYFEITYENPSDVVNIKVYEDASMSLATQTISITDIPSTTHKIKIINSATDIGDVETKFYINNKSIYPVEVYSFESLNNVVQPDFEVKAGTVSISDHISSETNSVATHRAFVIEVVVRDTKNDTNSDNDVVIADIKATKIDD